MSGDVEQNNDGKIFTTTQAMNAQVKLIYVVQGHTYIGHDYTGHDDTAHTRVDERDRVRKHFGHDYPCNEHIRLCLQGPQLYGLARPSLQSTLAMNLYAMSIKGHNDKRL